MLGKRNLSKRYRKLEATSLAEQGKGRVIVLMLDLAVRRLWSRTGSYLLTRSCLMMQAGSPHPWMPSRLKMLHFFLWGRPSQGEACFARALGEGLQKEMRWQRGEKRWENISWRVNKLAEETRIKKANGRREKGRWEGEEVRKEGRRGKNS